MGFFSNLLGGGQRRDIRKAKQAAVSTVNDYYDRGRATTQDFHDRALTFLTPQLEAGRRASDTYETALGLLGADAQREYMENYTTSPGFESKLEAGNRNIMTNAAARGYALSGRALKELRDFGHQMLSDDYNAHLDRLATLSARGNETARGAAELTSKTGADLAQSYYGQGGTLANIELQSGAAIANTRFSLGDLGKLIGNAARTYAAFG